MYHLLRRIGFGFFPVGGGGRDENIAYVIRVHLAGGVDLYERTLRGKLLSLLRRHVAPRAPYDVLHVIVSFWGHAGSY